MMTTKERHKAFLEEMRKPLIDFHSQLARKESELIWDIEDEETEDSELPLRMRRDRPQD